MPSIRIRVTPTAGADRDIGDALAAFFETQLGPRIKNNARRTVPVRTGRLRNELFFTVERDGGEATLIFGDQAPYAYFVEKGTSKMRAQPYIVPAVLQAGGSIG